MLRLLTLLLLLAAPTAAQPVDSLAPNAPPPADSADVASVDAILTALYSVISGEAGQARDWDRMRSLFLPEGRLTPTGAGPDGANVYAMQTVDDYIGTSGALLVENGFLEREIGRRVQRFGAVAHAWSAYEARQTAGGEVIVRGVNSVQLFWDGARWWIASVMWQPETPTVPLPDDYIGPG